MRKVHSFQITLCYFVNSNHNRYDWLRGDADDVEIIGNFVEKMDDDVDKLVAIDKCNSLDWPMLLVSRCSPSPLNLDRSTNWSTDDCRDQRLASDSIFPVR